MMENILTAVFRQTRLCPDAHSKMFGWGCGGFLKIMLPVTENHLTLSPKLSDSANILS